MGHLMDLDLLEEEFERLEHIERVLAVADKTWCVFLHYFDLQHYSMIVDIDDETSEIKQLSLEEALKNKQIIVATKPEYSYLFMLDMAGPYRKNKRPFERFYEYQTEKYGGIEILSREDAEADARFEKLRGYFKNVEKRVRSFWKERQDKPCSSELAPSDEKIPWTAPRFVHEYKKPIYYGLERYYVIVGCEEQDQSAKREDA